MTATGATGATGNAQLSTGPSDGDPAVAGAPKELTVGDIRREIEGLPDDAPLFVTVPGGYDLPITWAVGHTEIIYPSDAERGPDGRWPTRLGLEMHADPEWSEDERDSVQRSIGTALVGHVTQGEWDLSYRLRKALNLVRLPDKAEPVETPTPHDCGHTCCDDRHDPMHDHFLAADKCPSCVSGTP